MTVTLAPGVAVVIPVHRQAHRLPSAVETVLGALDDAGLAHSVIIVDDASTDSTPEVVEWLARRYPGRVEVVRHDSHRGPEAARASGVEAALARTDHDRVLLADVDARAWAADLPRWLADAVDEQAEVVLGRRRFGRRPYELLDRRVLQDDGTGAGGAVPGPDPVARAREDGTRVIERPVTARRRRPPNDPPAPSFRTRLRGRWWARKGDDASRSHSPALALVTVGATVASVVALLRVLAANAVLTYPDAVAHLLIARRVVESPTPGAAQLGGVWLPLAHVLAVPTVWIPQLYLSGIAGSLVSMGAFVLTCRFLYRILDELTGSRPAAIVAAATFALCPNVLYLQSTPMTELPLLCGIAGATYHLVRWARTDRHLHLAMAGGLMLLVTLVRYEAWPFCFAGMAVVVIAAWRRGRGEGLAARLRFTEAHVLYFAVLAGAGIAAWVLWNAAIFGDPLFFFDGEYSESSVWVNAEEATAGNWLVSLQTYWYAVVDNVGVPLTLAGALGFLVLCLRTRLRGPALAALTPLVLLPFFLAFLYSGQRPLHVLEITGDRNNVRFGLIMIVPIAVFVGYLVATASRALRRRQRVLVSGVVVVLVGLAALGAARGGVATLEEARFFRSLPFEQGNARAAAWLRSSYDGGTIMMNNFGNQTVAFDSGIPTTEILHDGSYGLWEPALSDPAEHGIEWIYMRSSAEYPDPVWAQLHDAPQLAGYRLVYDADERRIYRRVES